MEVKEGGVEEGEEEGEEESSISYSNVFPLFVIVYE